MKFSIVIPVLNAASYLEETLQSIFMQKGVEIEVILEDGMSNDGTLEMVEQFKAKNRKSGFSLKIHSQKDGSLYEAVVRGFGKATGDVITYISGTDYYLPNAFSTIKDVLEEHENIHWITGIPVSYNAKGQNFYSKLPVAYHRSLIQKGFYDGKFLHFIQQESCFIRNSALANLQLDEILQYPYAGDQKLWHMLSQDYELYIIHSYLSGSRMHGNRVSENKAYQQEFKAIRDARNPFSYLKAGWQYLLTYLLPDKLKKMLAPRLLSFNGKSWN